MRPTARALLACLALPAAVHAAGPWEAPWPGFRGPRGDGVSVESLRHTVWPAAGPREVWRVPLGAGFSALVADAGRVYTLDSQGDEEFALCLDAATGRELWRTRVGPIFQEFWGDGPRASPTLEGDTLFVLGSHGSLMALRSGDGSVLWEVDLPARFGSGVPEWGFAGAPLVVEGRVVVDAAGQGEGPVVALDAATGATQWEGPRDATAYSSPILVELSGRRQIVLVTASRIQGLSLEGALLWTHPYEPDKPIKPAMPVSLGGGRLFVSAAYDVGARALALHPGGGRIRAEEVWRSPQMSNHFNGSVLVGRSLYGFDNATLKCIDAASGAERWAAPSTLGQGSLIAADGHLIVLGESGRLLLVEASPERFQEKGSAQVLRGRCWTSPTLASGRLFLRSQKEAVCLEI